MLPPAPALFSTTNCWPNSSDIFAATTRARMSVVPPAANGTTNRTGRAGQLSARARRDSSGSAPSAAPPSITLRRVGRGGRGLRKDINCLPVIASGVVSAADAFFLEVFQRARMERNRRAGRDLVVERKALGLLVHGDDV